MMKAKPGAVLIGILTLAAVSPLVAGAFHLRGTPRWTAALAQAAQGRDPGALHGPPYAATRSGQAGDGFVSLFNGRDLGGWKVPAGDNGHWRVVDGVIDYDAESEAAGDKSLWSEQSYADFVLRADWRIKATPFVNPSVPIIRFDGTHKKDASGREIRIAVPDSDSGIYLRGSSKAQVNIWGWPIGSGEVYGYRTDAQQPAAVRAGVTPKKNADRDIGAWNTFEITMRGDRLTVVLNGEEVIGNAQLPGVAATGSIALQHHGEKKNGVWTGPPSLVQFRNLSIKTLPSQRRD